MTTDWRAELHARQLRATPARIAVLDTLHRLGHATTEQVLTEAGSAVPGLNASTVYRTLEALREQGVVNHIHLAGGVVAFQLHSHGDHAHLVCRGCAAVLELDEAVAEDLIGGVRRSQGFDVDLAHLSVFGRCEACATASRAGSTST